MSSCQSLAANGAYFSESHGWELPDWFAPTPAQAKIETYSWSRQSWFEWHAEEHRAAREDAIIMDMTAMSKFAVEGPDALALLSRLSCNEVDVERSPMTELEPGQTVRVRAHSGQVIGSAYVNPRSLICARIIDPGGERILDAVLGQDQRQRDL